MMRKRQSIPLNLKSGQKDDNKTDKITEDGFSFEQEAKTLIDEIGRNDFNTIPITHPYSCAFMKKYGEVFWPHLSFEKILKLFAKNGIAICVDIHDDDHKSFSFTLESNHGYDFSYKDLLKHCNTAMDKKVVRHILELLLGIGYDKYNEHIFSIIEDNIFDYDMDEENREYSVCINEIKKYTSKLKRVNNPVFLKKYIKTNSFLKNDIKLLLK